jgi:tetratricopeptide (TPR) repeat protein
LSVICQVSVTEIECGKVYYFHRGSLPKGETTKKILGGDVYAKQIVNYYGGIIRCFPVNRHTRDVASDDWDKIIADNTAEIAKNPDSPVSVFRYIFRGIAYHYKNENDLALADFNKAIALDPQDPTAYYWRGNSYYAKKQLDLALADYNKAIKLDPKLKNAVFYKGVVCDLLDKKQEAIEAYESFLRLDPTDREQIDKAKERIEALGSTVE